MKTIFMLFVSLILFSCSDKKEKTTSKSSLQSIEVSKMKNDSLVLKKYVGGDPFMNRIDTEIEVAKNWGFIIEYTYGDCGGTYDHLIKEFENHNKQVLKSLKNKFGRNWEVTFENQVILNKNPWYFNVGDFDGFLKTDTLKLTTKKGKASLTFKTDNTCVLTFKTDSNKTKYIIASSYHLFEDRLFLNLPNEKSLNYNIKSIKSNEIIMNRFKFFTRS